MKQFIFIFLTFFKFSTLAFSQTGTITGQIKDAETGETLPFCNVFVNNTTIATVTDMEGKYTLSGLEAGALELGFSFMGYVAETRKVNLNPGGTLTINLGMKPFAQELSDVEIKASRDKNWERDLRKFQNLFIGIDDAAAKTTILNPWVIDFPSPTEKGTFVAKADQPIEIENAFLGYKITFNLKDFFVSPTSYRIAGAARFEEMKSESDPQNSTWEKNRAEVYRKSPMNMFRSILKGSYEREGFYLYGDKAGGSASMNMRSDIFANELGKSVGPYKAEPLVTPTSPPGTYLLNLKGRIEIHYQKGFAQANTYKDAPYPISWMEVNKGQVKVKENGMVLNPEDIIFSGDMDRKRISNLLPLDYNAEKAILLQDLAKTAKNYQEKVYLHTDKPYYYAGDQLFFKGYFAYGNPYLRDELSKVLHVEVITPDRDLVIEKKFPIRDGIVVGDFFLPDTLNGEKYFLRAYTNWMRNYGSNQYFLQPLSILNPYKRIVDEESVSKWINKGVALQSNKVVIGPREKVTITLKLTDPKGRPTSSTISVGAWDAEQLVPVQRYPEMNTSLNLTGVPENLGLERFSYPVEKNLKFSGKVTDDKGRGVAADVTAFVNDFQGMIEVASTSEGNFALEDMEFYGPMRLGFAATDKKGKPLTIKLESPLKAPISLPSDAYFPKVNTIAKPIRLQEKPEEILVTEKVSPGSKSQKAIYGNPDFIIEGEKLTKTGSSIDLVNSIVGNIPGAQVNLVGGTGQQTIRLRGGAVSARVSMEPVVMLDGVVFVSGGVSTAADNIRSINPFDIERVEVASRMVPMLGDQGRNGVIAIYLKDNLNRMDDSSGRGIAESLIEGYQPPGNFFYLDYQSMNLQIEKDDRQTLYWNPYLVTDEKGELSFSFFSNDSPGPIVVEIRGLTAEGDVITGTFVLNKK